MTENKTVCHVTTVHPESDPRIYFKQILSLANAGFKVNFIVQENKVIKSPLNVQIFHLPKASGFISRLKNLFLSLRLVLKSDAFIFQLHDPELLFHGLILKIFTDKKVIFDIHELTFDAIMYKDYLNSAIKKPLSIIYKYTERWIIKVFDHIILAEQYYEQYYNTNKQTIIQNFIPAAYVLNQPVLNKNWQILELVYIGTISSVRGIEQIIELAALLKGRLKYRLHIVGEFESTEFRNKIENLILKHNLKSNIVLHGRKLFSDGQDLLKKCHVGLIFLHPIENYKGTLPTKLFEYMSKGLVILMTNFEGWTEFNSKYHCGLTLDIFNLENEIERVIGFIENKDGLTLQAAENIKIVRNNYTWESEEKKLLELYSSYYS